MSLDNIRQVFGYFLIAVVSAFGLVALIKLLHDLPILSNQGAAWVQALGSVAALIVAIYVMGRQNAHTRRLALEIDEKAVHRKALTVCALMERASKTVDESISDLAAAINTAVQSNVNLSLITSQHIIVELSKGLSTVPSHELGSYDMAVGVNKMLECISVYRKMLESWQNIPVESMGRQLCEEKLNIVNELGLKALASYYDGLTAIGLTPPKRHLLTPEALKLVGTRVSAAEGGGTS